MHTDMGQLTVLSRILERERKRMPHCICMSSLASCPRDFGSSQLYVIYKRLPANYLIMSRNVRKRKHCYDNHHHSRFPVTSIQLQTNGSRVSLSRNLLHYRTQDSITDNILGIYCYFGPKAIPNNFKWSTLV